MYNVLVSTSSTLQVLSTVNYDNMRVGHKHHACEYTCDNSMIALTYFIIQTDYLWSIVRGGSLIIMVYIIMDKSIFSSV